MAVVNTRKGKDTTFAAIPTDTYTMKIVKAEVEENQFGTRDEDGNLPEQLVLTWEISHLTEDQQEAGVTLSDRVWQRMSPWYGTVKAGGPSKFKDLIDKLIAMGHIAEDAFDEFAFDTDLLLNAEMKVMVECYVKSMGKNAGTEGNKVLAVSPLKRPSKNTPQRLPEADVPEPEIRFLNGLLQDIKQKRVNGAIRTTFGVEQENGELMRAWAIGTVGEVIRETGGGVAITVQCRDINGDLEAISVVDEETGDIPF